VPEANPGPALRADGVTLEREHACFEALNWRCTLDVAPPPPPVIVERMLAAGWREVKRVPTLLELFDPGGNRVAYVVTTGRMQIRINPDRPEEERPAAAIEVARAMVRALGLQSGHG
jgi:hypothetical protein